MQSIRKVIFPTGCFKKTFLCKKWKIVALLKKTSERKNPRLQENSFLLNLVALNERRKYNHKTNNNVSCLLHAIVLPVIMGMAER